MKLKESVKFLIVFLVLVGIVITTVVVQLRFNFFASADPTLVPEQILVTNLGSNSATISFMNFAKTTSSIVKYGTSVDKLDQVSNDVNKTTADPNYSSNIHYHKLTNLVAETKYYYVIYVNGQLEQNSGVPFEFSTLKTSALPEVPNSVYGKVIGDNTECIVNMHALNGSEFSTPLSTFLAENGTYTLDAGQFLTRGSNANFVLNDSTKLIVFATCADDLRGGAKLAFTSRLADIEVSDTFAVGKYSIDLTDIAADTGENPTSTVRPTLRATTAPSNTPRVGVTNNPPTNTPPNTSLVQNSPTPIVIIATPTDALPRTGIADDLPIYLGLLLVILGLGINVFIRQHKQI